MIFNILFLPVLLFIGLITTYEDIRYGKIRNKWIKLGLVWGTIVIISFLVWFFIASPVLHFYYFEIRQLPPGSPAPVFVVNLEYLGRVVVNTLIALLTAFLMWRAGAWAAGDGKLFVVFALLLPLQYYWKSYLPYFPSFVLLINIFIPFFIYLLFISVSHWLKFIYLERIKKQSFSNRRRTDFALMDPSERERRKQAKKQAKRKAVRQKLKNMLAMLSVFISIFLIFGLFQDSIQKRLGINISSFQMFVFAGLIIFSGSLSKIFNRSLVFGAVIVALAGIMTYGFLTSPQITGKIFLQSFKMMLVFMIVLGLCTKLINFYIQRTGLREIPLKNLGPKMSLDEAILNQLKEDQSYYDKNIGYIYPSGLTVQQAEAVKKWLMSQEKFKSRTIKIYQPFPFVPWMFLGIILTLFLKQSLLHLFLNLV